MSWKEWVKESDDQTSMSAACESTSSHPSMRTMPRKMIYAGVEKRLLRR